MPCSLKNCGLDSVMRNNINSELSGFLVHALRTIPADETAKQTTYIKF